MKSHLKFDNHKVGLNALVDAQIFEQGGLQKYEKLSRSSSLSMEKATSI